MSNGFVIWAPPYVENSAGIRALYELGSDLRKRGFAAFMCGGSTEVRNTNVLVISNESARDLCRSGYVAIYPEVVSGNPFGASTVVRWVLNRPGLCGGDLTYDPSEIVFTYSEVYRPYISNSVAGRLYRPMIDQKIFWAPRSAASRRDLICFYVGKSQWKEGVVDRDESLELTRSWPDRSQLGKILRKSRALYCFDNSSMLIYEALLCGCPVAVVPDGTQRWEDYLTLELGVEGISWGTDSFVPGEFDAASLRGRIERAHFEYRYQLDTLLGRVAERADIGPCPNFDVVCRSVEAAGRLNPLRALVRGIRSRLRAMETGFRRGRRAVFRKVFGPRQRVPVPEVATFSFDASLVPIPRPGSRVLNCHVRRSPGFNLPGLDDESVELNPSQPFNPRTVALLLARSKKLVLGRRWQSMAELAERCGCEVVDRSDCLPAS